MKVSYQAAFHLPLYEYEAVMQVEICHPSSCIQGHKLLQGRGCQLNRSLQENSLSLANGSMFRQIHSWCWDP